MAKKAEVDIVVNKDDALKNLGDVDQKLAELEKKGAGIWSRFYGSLDKETRKALDKAGEAVADSAKSAILGQVTSLGRAIAAPGMSTFGDAISKANQYRSEVQRVATSTGSSFESIDKRIRSVAMSTGELPQTVMHYAGAVRALTGSWSSATATLSSFQDRALQLGRPLESLVGTAANLENAFGMKTTAQVDRFFGTLDAYAKNSGMSAERLQRQWDAFGGAFGRLSGGDPTKFAGITAAFAASAANPEQAMRNQAFGMGLMNTSIRQLEQRMRRAGKLDKGKLLTDESGGISDENYARAMRFLQEDVIKYYGSKQRAVEVQAGDDLEARRSVAGFLNTDFSGTKTSTPAALPRTASKTQRASAAGGREQAEVGKYYRDVDTGKKLLPGQDAAVRNGGGGRGILASMFGDVLGTAVNQFGGIGLGAMGGYLARGVPKFLGAGRTAALGAGLSTPIAGAAGIVGGLAGGLAAGAAGYEVGTALDQVKLNGRGETASDLLSRKIFEMVHPEAEKTFPMSAADVADLPQNFRQAQTSSPVEVAFQSSDLRSLTDGFAQALRSQVLRVVPVDPGGGPEGQPNL